MKRYLFFLSLAAILSACGGNPRQTGNTKNAAPPSTDQGVMVYYFHGKQRCKTCVAVQSVAQATVKESFSQNSHVVFKEVDLSARENNALAEKYQVAWSSLVIASPIEHANITMEAFSLALNQPDSLSALIKNEVNNYLLNL